MPRIILVRHAKQGEGRNASLIDRGKDEARRTGAHIANRYGRVAAFYTSPLNRARETTDILRSALKSENVSVETTSVLAERIHWREGMSREEWEGALTVSLLAERREWTTPHGDDRSIADAGAQVKDLLVTATRNYPRDATIIVVSHAATIDAFIRENFPAQKIHRLNPHFRDIPSEGLAALSRAILNGSLTVVTVDNGELTLESAGDVRHLEGNQTGPEGVQRRPGWRK